MLFCEYCEIFKSVYFKEIYGRLLLNNAKPNFSSVFPYSQENTRARVFFLINAVATCNVSLSLFKKRLRRWCFPDSYQKFLTTTFLKSIVVRKKSIVIRNVDQIAIANLITHLLSNFAKISVFQHSS